MRSAAGAALLVMAAFLASACAEAEPPLARAEPSAVAPVPELPAPPARASGGSGSVRITAVGDYDDLEETTGPVLEALGEADPDVHLALGDFSYDEPGAEQEWCDFVSTRVGPDFPFLLLAGNHDTASMDGYTECLPSTVPGLHGDYGREYVVDVPRGDPLVRIVALSPGLELPDGRIDYEAGSERMRWVERALRDARTARVPWVVVAMHMPCLSVGEHDCTAGADLMEVLVREQVDLVLTGHEHLYQRTVQLGTGPGCPQVLPGTFDDDCVADDDDLTAGLGTVFTTVGTGGVELHDVGQNDTEAPYFAAVMGANEQPTHGFLTVDVSQGRMAARFVPVTGEGFTDAFDLTR
jgi:3',5'-cyclic AMP phosphodiesterase CpdA